MSILRDRIELRVGVEVEVVVEVEKSGTSLVESHIHQIDMDRVPQAVSESVPIRVSFGVQAIWLVEGVHIDSAGSGFAVAAHPNLWKFPIPINTSCSHDPSSRHPGFEFRCGKWEDNLCVGGPKERDARSLVTKNEMHKCTTVSALPNSENS